MHKVFKVHLLVKVVTLGLLKSIYDRKRQHLKIIKLALLALKTTVVSDKEPQYRAVESRLGSLQCKMLYVLCSVQWALCDLSPNVSSSIP